MLIQPVMAGINWYSDMFDPDKDGVVHVGGELAGGHEILLIGIDFANKRIRMRNLDPAMGEERRLFHFIRRYGETDA